MQDSRDFAIGDILVYAVAGLLLVSVVLFIKAALFDRRPPADRPRRIGLLLALFSALLAIPLYLIYYADRWPFGDHTTEFPMRRAIGWMDGLADNADSLFQSHLAPALITAGLLLVHMIALQRLSVRDRLKDVYNPIANFFAGAVVATLVGGIVVSTFHWGWIGAVVVAVIFGLVYLGALALLAAIVQILVELAKLIGVWLKRKAFRLATWITEVASWVSSLAGRLGLLGFAERIRQKRLEQEGIFIEEVEEQDRELYEAHLRYLKRREQILKRRGQLFGEDDGTESTDSSSPASADPEPAALAVPTQAASESSAPVEVAATKPDQETS